MEKENEDKLTTWRDDMEKQAGFTESFCRVKSNLFRYGSVRFGLVRSLNGTNSVEIE